MQRSSRALVIICSLILCLSASAKKPEAPPAVKDTWTSVQSKHFFLVGNAGEKDIRKVATKFEQFREVFSRLFTKAKLNSQVPIHIIVFKSYDSYRPFMPGYQGKVNEVAGYYQSGQDLSYITLTSEFRETNPFSTIFHEYVHAIANDNIGHMPPWFGEGLAEFYSTFEVSDGDRKVLLGKPIAHHVYLLRENKFLPLARLFAVDHNSPEYNEQDKKGVFYAQSWALVHYLMLGGNVKGGVRRHPQFLKFLQLIGTGAPVGECFQNAFETDFATVEKELRDYIGRNSYPVQNITFDQKLEFDATMQSAPISEAEAQYHLGDLLQHSNRTDCETYLQRALQLDPNLTGAHASMGMLRMRQGKLDEAKTHFRHALSSDSTAAEKPSNYLAHYYYAFTLSREDAENNVIRPYSAEKAEAIRAELRKAIALNPEFAESYDLMAFVNIVTGEQLDEAVTMLRRAIALSPSRQDFVMKLAHVYLRQQKLDEARRLLEPMARGNADPQMVEQAQSLLDSIARQLKMQAEYEAALKASGADSRASSTAPGGNESPLPARRPLMRRRVEGEQAKGQLTAMECTDKGVTLTVKANDRTFKFHAENLDRVQFITYTTDVGKQLDCGPLKDPLPVIVTYRSSTDARSKFDGEPLAVEFMKPE